MSPGLKIVLYQRPETGEQWHVHECPLSGRTHLDDYAACYQARRHVWDGAPMAIVVDGYGHEFARFSRSVTGEIVQAGGIEL